MRVSHIVLVLETYNICRSNNLVSILMRDMYLEDWLWIQY